jgi:hypothetical protein
MRRMRLPRDRHSAPTQIGLFLAAYLLYDLARWVTAGDVAPDGRHRDDVTKSAR